jgi:hypothetical protein
MLYHLTVINLLIVTVFASTSTTWEGGTNTPLEGILHEFFSLDPATAFAYLTVDVYQSE